MKRALGIIVSATFKAGNVAFPKSGKSIFVSVRLGKFFKFSKLSPAVVLLFLRHIGCGAHTLILSVAPPEKVALFCRTVSAFQHFIFHNRKLCQKVNCLKEGRAHA